MAPEARTPRLQELPAKLDALAKEQRAPLVEDERDEVYRENGATGLDASTSPDRTSRIVGLPSNELELWMWLEPDRLANPVFHELNGERTVILEERRQTLESRRRSPLSGEAARSSRTASPTSTGTAGPRTGGSTTARR